jgi:hypothetical protein
VFGLRLEGERGGHLVDATVTSAVYLPEPATGLLLAIGIITIRHKTRKIHPNFS